VSYESALEAAGAKVLAFEQFGSYQGEWYALVEFNGERGWINGSYGSCSHCDAFEGEFGYSWGSEKSADGRYLYPEDDGHSRHAEYKAKLTDFGLTYLGTMLTQEQAEAEAGRYSWDCDADKMLAFVKSHAEVSNASA
jgi:hypothetical protein